MAFDRERKPGVSNLLEILGAVTNESPSSLATTYTQYGKLKQDTGEAVAEMLRPIQSRYHELMADPAELSNLLALGKERASKVASATLARAHSAIGLYPSN